MGGAKQEELRHEEVLLRESRVRGDQIREVRDSGKSGNPGSTSPGSTGGLNLERPCMFWKIEYGKTESGGNRVQEGPSLKD